MVGSEIRRRKGRQRLELRCIICLTFSSISHYDTSLPTETSIYPVFPTSPKSVDRSNRPTRLFSNPEPAHYCTSDQHKQSTTTKPPPRLQTATIQRIRIRPSPPPPARKLRRVSAPLTNHRPSRMPIRTISNSGPYMICPIRINM